MLDIDDLDPARLPQRKSKSDYVELVSRSREADVCVVLVITKLWTEQCLLWARFSLIP